MGDYYSRYLTAMSMVGGNQMASPFEVVPMSPAVAGIPIHIAPGGPMQGVFPAMGYIPAFPESVHYPPPKLHKSRRKQASGTDHVKHRRTRSGCYTCRLRRIKCDEARPICERCKKGKRECSYPDPPQRKTPPAVSSSSRGSQPPSPATSADDVADMEPAEHESHLEAIPDVEDEDVEDEWAGELPARSEQPRRGSTTSASSSWRPDAPRWSETPSHEDAGGPSPSTSTTSGSQPAYPPSPSSSEWAHLPADLRQHLDFYQENITHWHYCMSSDVDDFFRLTLPGLAVRDEALLHAVVSFTAYHAALQDPNGKLDDFLGHFNSSVKLLIKLFSSDKKPNVGTLLTILQLATIEEYLGDWISLLGHQKAALEIMTDLFTPQEIMQTPLGRVIVLWYLRFDVFVALMGGFHTALPHEWFETMVEYYWQKSVAEPDSLRYKYAHLSADMRLLSMELSLLITRSNDGTVTAAEFAAEYERLSVRLERWRSHMDPALLDPAYLVRDLSRPDNDNDDDIFSPHDAGVLYAAPLFATTVMVAEWLSVMIMLRSQSPAVHTDREKLYVELAQYSYAIAQGYEAVELWEGAPKGALTLMLAPLAEAFLFLPQDERYHRWFRRRFATQEQMGYILPRSSRIQMAELFQDKTCQDWWLPHHEGFTPVLARVRQFADERSAVAHTAQAEALTKMRHLFSKLMTAPAEGGGRGGDGEEFGAGR